MKSVLYQPLNSEKGRGPRVVVEAGNFMGRQMNSKNKEKEKEKDRKAERDGGRVGGEVKEQKN